MNKEDAVVLSDDDTEDEEVSNKPRWMLESSTPAPAGHQRNHRHSSMPRRNNGIIHDSDGDDSEPLVRQVQCSSQILSPSNHLAVATVQLPSSTVVSLKDQLGQTFHGKGATLSKTVASEASSCLLKLERGPDIGVEILPRTRLPQLLLRIARLAPFPGSELYYFDQRCILLHDRHTAVVKKGTSVGSVAPPAGSPSTLSQVASVENVSYENNADGPEDSEIDESTPAIESEVGPSYSISSSSRTSSLSISSGSLVIGKDSQKASPRNVRDSDASPTSRGSPAILTSKPRRADDVSQNLEQDRGRAKHPAERPAAASQTILFIKSEIDDIDNRIALANNTLRVENSAITSLSSAATAFDRQADTKKAALKELYAKRREIVEQIKGVKECMDESKYKAKLKRAECNAYTKARDAAQHQLNILTARKVKQEKRLEAAKYDEMLESKSGDPTTRAMAKSFGHRQTVYDIPSDSKSESGIDQDGRTGVFDEGESQMKRRKAALKL